VNNKFFHYLMGLVCAGAIFLYFSPRSHIYDVSLAEAHDTLANTALPPIFSGLGDAEDSAPDFSVDASEPHQIVWTFMRDGNPLINVVATLKPASDHSTHILVDMTDPQNDLETSQWFDANRTTKSFYLKAMREQISSVMEKRDFNMTSFYPELKAATTANVVRLNAKIRDMLEQESKHLDDYNGRPFTSSGRG
jgi:hypothetical protein